jgi:hypothetical protein
VLLLILLAICTVLAGPAQPAAAASAFLRVPGDAATIQEAVDNAKDDQEVRVKNGVYFETLFISKTLRLTGGWNDDFTLQDSVTIVDAGFGGRALTVQPRPRFNLALDPAANLAAPITPTVVISRFAFIGGTAQGLGGALLPEVPNLPQPPDITAAGAQPAPAAAQPLTPDPETLRAELQALAAAGGLPGGDTALQSILRRLDAAAALPPQQAAGTPQAASPATPDFLLHADCGGGIYLRAAYLHLINVEVSNNVATGAQLAAAGFQPYGAGGGICAVDLPTGGLHLERTVISRNTASAAISSYAAGFGGGLFVGRGLQSNGLAAAGDGLAAPVNAAPVNGALIVNNVRIDNNTAATNGGGYGGGAFITLAPAAALDLAMFSENYATQKGTIGYGGGLFVGHSSAVTLGLGGFEGNTASNTLATKDPAQWAVGEGGGIYLYYSPGFALGSTRGQRSVFVGNLGALRGVGSGGAFASIGSPGLSVQLVEFLGNWGVIYTGGAGDFEGGGALFLPGSDHTRIVASEFADNVVSVFNLSGSRLSGGAVNAGGVEDFLIDQSLFRSNAGGTSSGGGLARGGAVGISRGRYITVTNSEFRDNAADLGPSGGLGGGLYLQLVEDALVGNNLFLRNRGGSGAGIGGALTLEGTDDAMLWPPRPFARDAGTEGASSINLRVAINANTFTANQAAAETGGGEANLGGALAVNSTGDLTLHNNVLAANSAADGAAMALFGYSPQKQGLNAPPPVAAVAEVANNTLFNNLGSSAIYAERWSTPLTLTNNIVVSHTVGIHLATNPETGGTVAVASHNLYNDNVADNTVDEGSTLTETGILKGLVAFVEPWAGDFHLQVTSAAIDAADPQGIPPAPAADRDGQSRPFRLAVDVGAYEWRGPLNFLPTIRKQACTVTPHVGWALGENADGSGSAILRTLDGGLSWTRQYTTTAILSGLDVVDAQHVWVSGDARTLLVTGDGGASWQKQVPPEGLPAAASINRISAVDARKAWASATAFSGDNNTGYILATDDGGATWSVQTSLPVRQGFISWIAAGDAANIWAAGGYTAALAGAAEQGGLRADAANGFILHSGDGGTTWRMEAETDEIVIGLDADGPDLVWGAGRFGAYRTLNGGAQWSFFNIFPTDANHVDAVDGGHVWVAGDNFTVLYTSEGSAPELPTRAWQNRSPNGLAGKVAYAVDFVDAENGWVAGGNFGTDPGGVIATTCNGGLEWKTQQWSEYDPIRAVDMAPAAE